MNTVVKAFTNLNLTTIFKETPRLARDRRRCEVKPALVKGAQMYDTQLVNPHNILKLPSSLDWNP